MQADGIDGEVNSARPVGISEIGAAAPTTEEFPARRPWIRRVDLSQPGTRIGPMVRIHGGFANRMYRLDTEQGIVRGDRAIDGGTSTGLARVR